MQIKESFASIAGSFTKTLVVSEVSAFVVALLPAWATIGIIVVAVATVQRYGQRCRLRQEPDVLYLPVPCGWTVLGTVADKARKLKKVYMLIVAVGMTEFNLSKCNQGK